MCFLEHTSVDGGFWPEGRGTDAAGSVPSRPQRKREQSEQQVGAVSKESVRKRGEVTRRHNGRRKRKKREIQKGEINPKIKENVENKGMYKMALLGRTRIFFGEIKTHSGYRASTY